MLKVLPLLSALFLTISINAPALAQDAEAGAKTFKKCIACHKVGEGAENGVGPQLNDLIGRVAGSVAGYDYGKDLAAAGQEGLVWTEDLISAYVADPRGFLRKYLDKPSAKAKMSFQLKKESDRLDVIAYLAGLSAHTDAGAKAETAAPAAPEMSVDDVIAAQGFSDDFLADPANFAAGKEIWFAQCTHCHGFKAYPGKAPKLKPAKYKPEFVFKRVYKGFKKMPAWRDTYTVDEIRQVVAYIKNPKFSP